MDFPHSLSEKTINLVKTDHKLKEKESSKSQKTSKKAQGKKTAKI